MGSKKEFVEWIKQHEGIIYKITRVYGKSKEDREDLYQEVVYQLWKSIDSYQKKSKDTTWLYRVALNTALNFSKNSKKRPISNESEASINLLKYESFDPVLEERVQLLYTHIERLNLIEKGIILLYLEGKSHLEISQVTGFSKSNIGTRIARIKQKLSKQLKS